MKIIITESQFDRLKDNLSEVSPELSSRIYGELKDRRLIMSPDTSITYRPSMQKDEVGYKPQGLWYGVGPSWLNWVRNEMPDWETEHMFEIQVDESRLLKLSDEDDLALFTTRYGGKKDYGTWHISLIDWSKVAEDYGGIEIAPYIYKARMKYDWYYPWDVASGCLWASGMVKAIEKLK